MHNLQFMAAFPAAILPPAGRRAEAAIAANPGKSDRAIAEEIGVSHRTVNRARKSTGTHDPVEKRVGKDGRARKMPQVKPAKVETFSADEFDDEDGLTVDMVEQANAANRRRYFLRCAADVQIARAPA